MIPLLKLNLGSGHNPRPGYVNVDKYGKPDVLHDLEEFPWPWETNSVGEVVLNHVLEHLGETVASYFGVIKELYRVCAPGAEIRIVVPHPRHDDFLTDPTHVRAITPQGLELFSQAKNEAWIRGGYANSPLGRYLGVDFEVTATEFILDEPWATRFAQKQISQAEVAEAVGRYFNVVKEIRMLVKAIKPGQ